MRERRFEFHWSLREIRFRSTKESVSSSRRRSSSIVLSSEKVGLSAALMDLQMRKLDGEAGGDENGNERDEHYDENDDSSEIQLQQGHLLDIIFLFVVLLPLSLQEFDQKESRKSSEPERLSWNGLT